MLLAHGTTYHELRDYLLSSSAWQVVVKAGADDKSEDLLQREQSQSSTTRVVMKVPFNEYGRSKLIAGTSKARTSAWKKERLGCWGWAAIDADFSVKGATRSILIPA
jgi:hypothetical protein